MRLSHLLLIFIVFFRGCNTSTFHDEGQLSHCHNEERTALLQFKQSFTISCANASGYAYPKMTSWKSAQGGNKTNCCTWDGVECDQHTGHVIGLDLNSSCLYGSIDSNNSLFRLVHLQRLDLFDNDFNYSPIPTSISNFKSLTYLDLSASLFSGRVPGELSQLVNLFFLELSYYYEPSSSVGLLKLEGSDFRKLVQNLTRLEHLSLPYINISSTIPYSMANLSLLTYLDLHHCQLVGEVPVTIFQFKNLKSIHLRENQKLNGHLPEFNQSSHLITLDLHGTNFSGMFPSSIGKIDSLKQLDVGGCDYFTKSPIPSSLGNLKQLTYLDLSWLFRGPIPDSFANLTKLTTFRMFSCRLTGPMPSWLGRFSQLRYLDFAYNTLNSSIPTSFFNLTSLEILFIEFNQLRGKLEFQMFQKLQSLKQLDISFNNLELVSKSEDMNATNFPPLTHLILKSLNFSEFPYFLKNQRSLEYIDFSDCTVQGQVPKWMYNVSTQTLWHLALDTNHLSGQLPALLPWVNLQSFSISDNNFHGSLPMPASSTLTYIAKGNNFMGKVLPLFCNLSSLQILDLSNNSLSGTILDCFRELRSLQALILSHNNFGGTLPQFLGNFSDSLVYLLLGNNFFHGNLPQMFSNKSNLKYIDVSYNQLEGSLPSSLANCLMLQSLDLSCNKLSGKIPQQLAQLKFLEEFNVSYNNLSGRVPTGIQFQGLNASSYEGNSELCGDPLPRKCGMPNTADEGAPFDTEDNNSWFVFEFDWKFVVSGFGSGLVMGVVLAHMAITRMPEIFLEMVTRVVQLMEMIKRCKMIGC